MGRQATMRRPAIQGRHVNVESLPACVGGWNARDSLANMDPMDAVTLQNWWPNVSNVELRGGYSKYATGLPGIVETIMVYNGGNTTEMWCWTDNGSLYNITGGGAAPAPTLTGKSNGQWEYTNISNSAGHFLVAVNGADDMLLYNGSAWSSINASSSPISITGVATHLLCNVLLFKHRLWFIEQYTLRLWYLPTDSLGGVAQPFDVGPVSSYGGHLVDLDTWTIDAGYGVDDNLVFVTSIGEVIVYAGTDPASITTFSLIGVWKLGSPIGTRCMLKWAGDLLILTFDGLLPMAASLQSSRLDPRVALSDKIQGAITQATTDYAGSHFAFGWQIIYSAKRNAVMINIPVGADVQQQYAMNTITKSWAQFIGWSATCWEIFNDDPYFGGNGYVGKAWDDSMADDGAAIQTFALQAFNYFQERGVKKRFIRCRPSIFTNGVPALSIGMATDFQLADTSAPLTFLPSTAGLWDSGLWDSGLWGIGVTINTTWQGVTGIGYCGAVQLKSASMGLQIQWASTDCSFELGGAGM